MGRGPSISDFERGRIKEHFENRAPEVKATYAAILKASKDLGPVKEEAKKTSIHLVNRSAFAGIATRKNALILNIKSAAPIKHARIHKSERLSANRFHQEVKLTSPDEVDPVLLGWLKEAFGISG